MDIMKQDLEKIKIKEEEMRKNVKFINLEEVMGWVKGQVI